ncbi:hypothetical protein TNCV_2522501 [Trichonephila clavipes]|nr:hypothetical protein TNCV_2522501 [Trichonephila clavipes]
MLQVEAGFVRKPNGIPFCCPYPSFSKAPSGEILLQSRKQIKVTWCEIKTVWCRRSKPRIAIWFCVAVAESSNNRTPDLRN